jgi:hypothetical protein
MAHHRVAVMPATARTSDTVLASGRSQAAPIVAGDRIAAKVLGREPVIRADSDEIHLVSESWFLI